MGYTVVDVETTGLSLARDRIVEVGVVLLDESGRPEDEWRSFVNPLRGTEAVFVHGLTDADVADAPTLTDLLLQVRGLFPGRTFVVHNTTSDVGFLDASFAQAGYDMHVPCEAAVCTMELSKIYPPLGRHESAAAAERAGVVMAERHCTLANARTVTGLLRHYLNAEADGIRYAERAFSHGDGAMEPIVWIEIRGAAVEFNWPDFLS